MEKPFCFQTVTPPLDIFSLVKTDPYLVVDTSLYPPEFQAALLTHLSRNLPAGLDAATDGLLIHSDNFQALNLLQARYREQVKCIYIDPPYNTGNDGFIYKDNYQHSSWLTLIANRISASYPLMTDKSALFCQISDLENSNLNQILNAHFGENNHRETITIVTSSKSGVNAINVKRGERLFKIKEYIHFYSKNSQFRFNAFYTPDKYNTNYKWEIYQNSDNTWNITDLKKDKDLSDAELAQYCLKYPEHIYSIEKNNDKAGEKMKIALDESKISGTISIFTDQYGRSKLVYDGGVCVPLKERIIIENNTNVFGVLGSDIWDDIGQAAKSEGGISFDNGKKPEKLLKRIIEMSSSPQDIILDFFAGSGTTACVAQKLHRKWIGIEHGEYFDNILRIRIQKTLFGESSGISKSTDYKGGGIVKVLQLESYEDTLNNLQLNRAKAPKLFEDGKPTDAALKKTVVQDYLLHYMLDIESRDSLLSTDDFRKPFDYRLNIASDSAGAYTPQVIDLVETFNYLLGLRVDSVEDRRYDKGYVFVEGRLNGELVLLVWRDCERWDYDGLQRLLAKKKIKPQESEFAEIYINGDHTLPTVWQDNDADGGMARTLKIRSIEAEFLRLMFAEAE
jgi:twin-argninine leader-binding protein dmsD